MYFTLSKNFVRALDRYAVWDGTKMPEERETGAG